MTREDMKKMKRTYALVGKENREKSEGDKEVLMS
jgi:hypothetical protein